MPTTSVRPQDLILDPTLSQPSAGEAGLIAKLGSASPLVAPFAAGLEMRRRAADAEQAQRVGENNALRSALGQRIAAQEFAQARFDTTASNLDQIAGAGGRDFAVAMLGEEPTQFSLEATPVDLAGLQADAVKTAAEAALAGGKAGLQPQSSEEFQDVTGFEVEPTVPLGVQEAAVSAQQPKIQIYDPATNGFITIPISPEEVPAHIRDRIGTAAEGTATGETVVPKDTAQAAAVDAIKRRVARDGGEHLATPREVQLSDGTRAIEYHVRLPGGGEFYYYAFEGDPQIRGSETPVGAR